MELEKMVKEACIEKILVVEDTPAYIQGAKEYFDGLAQTGLKVEYALGAKEASKMIQESFKTRGGKYDLVLTDLVMDTEESGFDVVRDAAKHLTFGCIVTDREADDYYVPTTTVLPLGMTVRGTKAQPETWETVFDGVMKYLTEGDGVDHFRSMQLGYMFIGLPSDFFAQMYMPKFDKYQIKKEG
jgi:CheY-like chemotaxis protein